jgi:hypothetical protein
LFTSSLQSSQHTHTHTHTHNSNTSTVVGATIVMIFS